MFLFDGRKLDGLRQEFEDELVSFSVVAGSRRIGIPADVLRPLQALGWSSWGRLRYAEFYEVPDSSYPPGSGAWRSTVE